MKSLGKAMFLGLAVATVSAVGCSGGPGGQTTEPAGTVGVELKFDPVAEVSSVDYTLAGPNSFSASGSFASDNFSFLVFTQGSIAGVPSGNGYVLDLTANSKNSGKCEGKSRPLNVSCSGSSVDRDRVALVCQGGNTGLGIIFADISISCLANEDGGVDSGEVDSGVDSGEVDSGEVDTGEVDTGVVDTGVIDSGVVDTGEVDTGVPDTGEVDTGVVDTGVPDTGTPDTGAPDTGAPDTGTPDTGAPDTGAPDTGVPDTGVPDTGAPDTGAPDTGAPDTGSPDAGPDPTACQTNNGGANCTPTELKFVAKDRTLGCYQCLVNGECLDNTVLGDTNKECGDVTGNATGGAQSGTAYNTLCLGLIDCILGSACASSDVSICYCGSLGAGNACSGGSSGANGKCIQQEVDGANHLVTDAPSAVFPSLGDLTNASGKANQIFVCAKSNSCDTMCSN